VREFPLLSQKLCTKVRNMVNIDYHGLSGSCLRRNLALLTSRVIFMEVILFCQTLAAFLIL